ncbi:MAG TPA: hypothetical protein VE377_24705 [Candidatus Dormibacteraeota bacterium]|nr:hypothetical protein [Candidatus Dormibacteraeota bacterium]
MRSQLVLLSLCVYFTFALGCTSKPPADSSTDTATSSTPDSKGEKGSGKESRKEREARKEAKREPLVVPSGTAITISLGSAIGSKLSQPGQTFGGSVAKDVLVGNVVAIPQGANVGGTVTDAKPLGRFKGGAVLQVRLDSINVNGADVPVQAAARSFSEKGKGKRTAVMAGGGAALGGIIGAIAGGGKGAAIGAAAGGGAGVGGAAFTGNKDIVLGAESDLTFELSQPLEVKR